MVAGVLLEEQPELPVAVDEVGGGVGEGDGQRGLRDAVHEAPVAGPGVGTLPVAIRP